MSELLPLQLQVCTHELNHSHDSAALALIRAGHEVIGTTRSAESAKKLEALESKSPLLNTVDADATSDIFRAFAVTPKVCDPLDPSQYKDLIAEVDVVIDAVGGDKLYKVGHTILDTCISTASKERPHGPPLSYIYCSGASPTFLRENTFGG